MSSHTYPNTVTSAPTGSNVSSLALSFWGLVVKEMLVWARSPLQFVISMASPLLLLAVSALLFTPSASNRIEIGVLMPPEPGPYTQKFVQKLASDTGVPMYFDIVTTNPQEAQDLFAAQQIFAIVTIPPDFDMALNLGQPTIIDFQVYNAMADVGKNVQLSFNRRLLEFNDEVLTGQVPIFPKINKMLPEDISRAGYLSVGILVYALMFTGILSTGIMLTKEWEYHTLPEILVSPTSRFVFIISKIVAGMLQAGAVTAIVFVIAYFFTDLRIKGNLLLLLIVMVFVGLMFVSFGALIGVAAKRFYLMMPASGVTAIVLWFLCGGFQNPVAVKGSTFYTVSLFLPPTYGFDALHKIASGASLGGVGFDILILSGSAIVFTAIATIVLQRRVSL